VEAAERISQEFHTWSQIELSQSEIGEFGGREEEARCEGEGYVVVVVQWNLDGLKITGWQVR
jgi:hypothetical protein